VYPVLVVGVFVVLSVMLIILGFPLFLSFGIAASGMILVLNYDPGFVVPCIFTNLNSFVFMAISVFLHLR